MTNLNKSAVDWAGLFNSAKGKVTSALPHMVPGAKGSPDPSLSGKLNYLGQRLKLSGGDLASPGTYSRALSNNAGKAVVGGAGLGAIGANMLLPTASPESTRAAVTEKVNDRVLQSDAPATAPQAGAWDIVKSNPLLYIGAPSLAVLAAIDIMRRKNKKDAPEPVQLASNQ